MQFIQIDNWQEYQRDGLQFLKTAQAAYEKKKQAFSFDTLYNLTCMGIEKLVMAFLMKRGDLAENHTMGDLYRALSGHLELTPELVEKLLWLDGFQEICDLESYTVRIPTEKDIVTILATGRELQLLLTPYLESEK